MKMPLIAGMTLAPISKESPISEPQLILHTNEALDTLVVIPITARKSAGRTYFVGYKKLSYQKIHSALSNDHPLFMQETFKPRPASSLNDEDLNRKYKKHGQDESNAVRSLKFRWQLIEPLVTGLDREILFDKEMLLLEVERLATKLAEEITYRSIFLSGENNNQEKSKTKSIQPFVKRVQEIEIQIKRLLNQYWAGGSTRGALINFGNNCGGLGKRKNPGDKHLGRKTARTEAGKIDNEALIIKPGDHNEEIIRHCIGHYLIRGVTVAQALRNMWTDYYSQTVQLDSGKTERCWLPANQRPTRSQFEHRIALESPEHSAWRKHLVPNAFERNFRSVMGSAADDVKAVGQRGAIDTSPIDFQLVKLLSRLERIGSAYRIILADSLFGYIPGFYVGLDAPSSRTVKLAMHHALDPDKSEWLSGLGLELEQNPTDWIPIHFVDLWADNTDMRSDEVMACLHGVGSNVHFVPVRRADRNPVAESRHHIIHRLVDHKMHGSTYGQARSERGELRAVDRARHTLIQAIRETARAVHTHNTMEIDIVRPIWMRELNVPPTRIAMTRATIARGRVARPLCSFDTAHIHLLPRHQGTFTMKGVRLHREDTGRKVCYIDPLTYVSSHPYVMRKAEEARRGGKHDSNYFRGTFLVDPYTLGHIWHLNLQTMELIRLELKILGVDDEDLQYEATIHDVVDLMNSDAIDRPIWREAGEQKLALMEEGQNRTKEEAEASYQAALKEAGGKGQSKTELRANRKVNRESEKASQLHGMPVVVSLGKSPNKQYQVKDDQTQGKTDQVSSTATQVGGPAMDSESSIASTQAQPRGRGSLLKAVLNANRKMEVPHGNQ